LEWGPQKPVPVVGAQLCQWNTRRELYQKVGNFVGSVVSPLLANIYLHELDRYMGSNYLSFSSGQRHWRRKQGKANFLYVRYADDFVVLCNGTKEQAQGIKEELGGLLSTMGLTLSEEKTKVTHITEGFNFLGYRIIRSMGQSGKMVPKVLIPDSAIKRIRHKMREMTAPHTQSNSVKAKIIALNRVTRGWCQYYQATSSPMRTFRKVKDEVFLGMAHWLGRKFKVSMPIVMQRYQEGLTFRTGNTTLILPTEIKTKRLRVKTWYNPYTQKEEIKREKLLSLDDLWTGHEHRHGWMDLKEEVILLKGTTCAMCGKELHPYEVQIDHIILRARFKNPDNADRIENQQVLCTTCHRAKTKIDRKVLSRMR
jgi:RNA-directed DNA polymerase